MDMKILKFALSFPSVIRLIGKHKMPELRFKLRTDTGRNVSEKAFFSLRGLSYENSSPVAFPLNQEKYIISSRSYTNYFLAWAKFILVVC